MSDDHRDLTALFASAREELPAEPFQRDLLAELDAVQRRQRRRRLLLLAALAAAALLLQGPVASLATAFTGPLYSAAGTVTLLAPLNSAAGVLVLLALLLRPVWRRLL